MSTHNLFHEILQKKDPQLVWEFLGLRPSDTTEEELIGYYSQLLQHTWHDCHDQIVSGFQWMSNPVCVNILYETALNEDIEPMDYRPIARKCTWALADIGTKEAREKLRLLAICGNTIIESYAQKRLDHWEQEHDRQGMKVRFRKANKYLYLDFYPQLEHAIETQGQQIITAQQTENEIIVYQAYNPAIADYAVKHQKFGGEHYSFNRMTWIKPNFLWMMYRSGWASKPDQERILAISIKKDFFLTLLREGELSSIDQSTHQEVSIWKRWLHNSEVRIQWDPHHRPDGTRLDRKAIQIGIKGSLQKAFCSKKIQYIEDITDYVHEQRKYIQSNDFQHLKVPVETEMKISDPVILEKLSISR